MAALSELRSIYIALNSEACRMAGGSADIHRRCEALREIECDSNGNVQFPAIAVREHHLFVAFYSDYYFSKHHGREPDATSVVDPCLLHLLNRVHRASNNGVLLAQAERQALFATASAIYGELNSGISSAAC